MNERLAELRQTKEDLQQKLGDPEILRNSQKVKDISIALAKVERELVHLDKSADLAGRIHGLKEMLAGGEPEDLKILARDELTQLEQELTKLHGQPADDSAGPQDIIVEIRAGAGGAEAAFFAYNLSTMYTKFAQKRGWRIKVLGESKSELDGYKEVIWEVSGEHAYDTLKWESGVHRVQRIPETEKTGRIHTSTASVAVLPKAREVDLEIRPNEIKVEFFRASGPGGQNVNKVETAVRIYHLPTGLMVTSQDSRSQQKNRETAMTILRTKLLGAKIQAEQKKMAAERKQQIGTGDRSEKIRTYNFPQDRVTDHRIKQSWHNLSSIMEGGIEPIIEALQAHASS